MKEFKETLAQILVMQLLVAAAVVEQLAGLGDEE
jgi:hypothetical protein